ncbi:MAG TPA: hypothetical protein PK467_19770, partial [Candidatus Wallbacteria bacterium]|nr:hypothetical protein [Candidatus Wallbacteria bacterium]
SMSDISSFDAYLGTDSATYAQGTQFTSSTIDSVNSKITFTHAGISISQNTDYYLKVGVKVPNSETLPTIGHSIKIQMDSSNPSDADYPPLVISSPLTGSTASTVSSVVYNATASSNSIYIDSSEIYLKVESESLADITMQFASGGAVSNHKIMELTLSNTSYSDYTIEKFIFNVKQEGTQTSFESLTSTMSLGVSEGSEKIADAAVAYDSSKLVGTFTISNFNSAYKTILKGQSKKLDIKFSSGSFTGATSPKVIFAIQSLIGSHTSGGSIVKGSQYTRIPIDTSKYFSWSASSSTVVEVGTSTPANAATDAAALITAAARSDNVIISFKRDITLQAAALDFSGGLKTVRMNNYSLTSAANAINISTNTTFTSGTINLSNTLTVSATKTLTLGENCTLNNAATGTINNIQGAIASNTQGTII